MNEADDPQDASDSNEEIEPPSPDELTDVPVFPLPRLVFFPGAELPLHFFEPRYRQMMQDCAEQDRKLMIVTQLMPGYREEYEGRPPIYSVAGLGRIRSQRRNADGTYDAMLEGIARVKLDELPEAGRPYRRARATLLHDLMPPAGVSETDLAGLLSLATQVGQHFRRNDPRFELHAIEVDPHDDPARFVDRLTGQLVPDPETRQELLETLDVTKRLTLLSASLAQLHLALLAADRDDDDEGGAPRVLH